jgi:SAM-dependent methyltransferase
MANGPSGARDIFTGTAGYYSRFRPGYPEEMFAMLSEKFGLNGCSRVLDLGCGPGLLSFKLAPYAPDGRYEETAVVDAKMARKR